MSHLIDLRGRRYGGLVVVERAEPRQAPSGSWATYWRARCECGAVVEVESQNLRRGYCRSCGRAGCRGRYPRAEVPLDEPVADLADTVQPGTLGTVVALLRASIDDDHAAIRDLVRSLDGSDDPIGLLLHLLRLCSTALVKAEGDRAHAHAVVDTLAALDRWQTR